MLGIIFYSTIAIISIVLSFWINKIFINFYKSAIISALIVGFLLQVINYITLGYIDSFVLISFFISVIFSFSVSIIFFWIKK